MASAVLSRTNKDQLARIDSQVDDRHGWGFALLLATTATLFIRPADLIPWLDQVANLSGVDSVLRRGFSAVFASSV